jgi:RNA polymerase sigma factor (TIGR02999 family)
MSSMSSTDERQEQADLHGALESGDPAALDRLFVLLYDDLRGIAASYLRDERPGHSLQPTALVHEVYLRLAGAGGIGRPRGRQQFLALAARALRRALVDHARQRSSVKRGAGWLRVSLDPEAGPVAGGESREVDILDLDAALEKLGRDHERAVRVFELRAFSGLTIAETAALLEVCTATVEDAWELARAWLWRELSPR